MNILYKIYTNCPNCRCVSMLKEMDYDNGELIQKCFACNRSWDLFGRPLGRHPTEDEKKVHKSDGGHTAGIIYVN